MRATGTGARRSLSKSHHGFGHCIVTSEVFVRDWERNGIRSTEIEKNIRALNVCERMVCWRCNDLRSPCGWIEFEGMFGKGIDWSNCKRRSRQNTLFLHSLFHH